MPVLGKFFSVQKIGLFYFQVPYYYVKTIELMLRILNSIPLMQYYQIQLLYYVVVFQIDTIESFVMDH